MWSQDPAVGGGRDAASRLQKPAPIPPSGREFPCRAYLPGLRVLPLCGWPHITCVLSDVSPSGRDGTLGTVAAAVRDHV